MLNHVVLISLHRTKRRETIIRRQLAGMIALHISMYTSKVTVSATNMVLSSSEADLLRRAQGSDVLSAEELRHLQELARRREMKRLNFFISRDGWLLRNEVRNHRVLQASEKYCALCGINTGRTALRSKPNSSYNQCFVNLCTVPRKDKASLSCWQEWY